MKSSWALRSAPGAAWAATALIDVPHPLWIALQATAWVGLVLVGLALLPGWRSRGVLLCVLLLLGFALTPLLNFPGPGLRVVALNTLNAGVDRAAFEERMRELDPDVVVLSETSTAEATALAEQLGFQVTAPVAPGGHGVAVLAATDRQATERGGGFHQMPGLTHAGFEIIGVHSAAPVNRPLAQLWQTDLAAVAAALSRPGPVIAAGDFNATAAHPAFRRLAATDCTLPVPTWPLPVSGLHLDHILVTGAECTGAGTFTVPGTDHRGVWADVLSS